MSFITSRVFHSTTPLYVTVWLLRSFSACIFLVFRSPHTPLLVVSNDQYVGCVTNCQPFWFCWNFKRTIGWLSIPWVWPNTDSFQLKNGGVYLFDEPTIVHLFPGERAEESGDLIASLTPPFFSLFFMSNSSPPLFFSLCPILPRKLRYSWWTQQRAAQD